MGITYRLKIASAHRTPQKVFAVTREAEEREALAIIAIAGKAAALPGLIAASTRLPVIGVPVVTSELAGLDALVSMTQTPKGIPVATMGLGKAGAQNAALLASRIAAFSNPEVREKLAALVEEMAREVEDAEKRLIEQE